MSGTAVAVEGGLLSHAEKHDVTPLVAVARQIAK